MILVDTSVWVDHFRHGEPELARLLTAREVLAHPFVTGELALGGLRNQRRTIGYLQGLPQAPLVGDDSVLRFISSHGLSGSGIGYIDAHLLAAARLMSGASLWTRDKRLKLASNHLGLAATLH